MTRLCTRVARLVTNRLLDDGDSQLERDDLAKKIWEVIREHDEQAAAREAGRDGERLRLVVSNSNPPSRRYPAQDLVEQDQSHDNGA